MVLLAHRHLLSLASRMWRVRSLRVKPTVYSWWFHNSVPKNFRENSSVVEKKPTWQFICISLKVACNGYVEINNCLRCYVFSLQVRRSLCPVQNTYPHTPEYCIGFGNSLMYATVFLKHRGFSKLHTEAGPSSSFN